MSRHSVLEKRKQLFLVLVALLRPLVRFCLRHSMHLQDLEEAAKTAFLFVGADGLKRSGEKVTLCRLSTMTGVHRRDTTRIYRDSDQRSDPRSLVGRVIVQWQQDPRFRTKQGKPRVLSYEGEDSEFRELVIAITQDVAPGTVLLELERCGAVEHTKNGLKLVQRVFIPAGDIETGFSMLSRDIECLLRAVEENLFGGGKSPHLHITTFFDRIPAEHEKIIRDWLVREGSALHQKARNFLSQYDKDVHPELDQSDKELRVLLNCFTLLTDADSDVPLKRPDLKSEAAK